MSLKEEDVTKMLVATTHLGSETVNFQMEQYVYKRRSDGVNIIHLGKTWEKLVLAARAIAAIEHPSDVSNNTTTINNYKHFNDEFNTNLSGLKFNEANFYSDQIENENPSEVLALELLLMCFFFSSYCRFSSSLLAPLVNVLC